MSSDLKSNFLQINIAMTEGNKNGVYSFDRFKIDCDKLMLYRDEIEISLPPKIVKTLTVLIENQGMILSKDELLEKVWPDAIVEESNLSQNLYVLRKAMGVKPDGGPYIETLRRRGYRFTSDVKIIERPSIPFLDSPFISPPSQPAISVEREGNVLRLVDWNAPQARNDITVPNENVAPPTGYRKSPFALALAGILILAIAATAFVFYRSAGSASQTEKRSEMTVTRLTNGAVPGGATISPDGIYIAYHELDGETSRLFVQQVGQTSRLEIASSSEHLFHALTFSNDGRFIYALTSEKKDGRVTLSRIPTIGGSLTRILTDINGPVSFSPDGSEMVFVRSGKSGDEAAIVISDSEGKNDRSILTRKAPVKFGAGPAWSPDGKLIAVAVYDPQNSDPSGAMRIILADVPTGKTSELSSENWENIFRMAWSFDGSGLVFVGTRFNEGYTARRDQVYFVSFPEGMSQRITSDGNRHEPNSLGLTKNGAILSVPASRSSQIWVMDSNGEEKSAMQISRGAADGRAGLCPLPDGRIAFISRTGDDLSLWIANGDGSGAKQLAGGFSVIEELRADNNGKFLVFSSLEERRNRLFKIDTDGSNIKQLTSGEGYEIDSAVAPDGGSIVFGSPRKRGDQAFPVLFRIPSEGGEPERIGSVECSRPQYSWDTAMISCMNASGEVLVISADDGAEIDRVSLPANATSNYGIGWSPDNSGLVVIIYEKGLSNLWVYPLRKGEPYRLTNFTSGVIYRYAFSPNGTRLYLARGYPTQDAVLITNYR